MKKGARVSFRGRKGTVVGSMPNGMTDVRFDDGGAIERRSEARLARANGRKPRKPRKAGRKKRTARRNAAGSSQAALQSTIASGRGMAVFTRPDPPRLGKDGSTYCGNPIDGTAYYIVVDESSRPGTRWITWDEVSEAYEKLTGEDLLSEWDPASGQLKERRTWASLGRTLARGPEWAWVRSKAHEESLLPVSPDDSDYDEVKAALQAVIAKEEAAGNRVFSQAEKPFAVMSRLSRKRRGDRPGAGDLPGSRGRPTSFIRPGPDSFALFQQSGEVVIAGTAKDSKASYYRVAERYQPAQAKLARFQPYGTRTFVSPDLRRWEADAAHWGELVMAIHIGSGKDIRPEVAEDLVVSGGVWLQSPRAKNAHLAVDPRAGVQAGTTITVDLSTKAASPYYGWVKAVVSHTAKEGAGYAECLGAEDKLARQSIAQGARLLDAYRRSLASIRDLFRGIASGEKTPYPDNPESRIRAVSRSYAKLVEWLRRVHSDARYGEEWAEAAQKALGMSGVDPFNPAAPLGRSLAALRTGPTMALGLVSVDSKGKLRGLKGGEGTTDAQGKPLPTDMQRFLASLLAFATAEGFGAWLVPNFEPATGRLWKLLGLPLTPGPQFAQRTDAAWAIRAVLSQKHGNGKMTWMAWQREMVLLAFMYYQLQGPALVGEMETGDVTRSDLRAAKKELGSLERLRDKRKWKSELDAAEARAERFLRSRDRRGDAKRARQAATEAHFLRLLYYNYDPATGRYTRSATPHLDVLIAERSRSLKALSAKVALGKTRPRLDAAVKAMEHASVSASRADGEWSFPGGERPIGERDKQAVFKTYNPVLFEATRLFWDTLSPERTESGSTEADFRGVLSRPRLLAQIDAVGEYGHLLEMVQAAAMQTDDDESFEEDLATQFAPASGMGRKKGRLMRNRHEEYTAFLLGWSLGLDYKGALGALEDFAHDPLATLRFLKERASISIANVLGYRKRPEVKAGRDAPFAFSGDPFVAKGPMVIKKDMRTGRDRVELGLQPLVFESAVRSAGRRLEEIEAQTRLVQAKLDEIRGKGLRLARRPAEPFDYGEEEEEEEARRAGLALSLTGESPAVGILGTLLPPKAT